MKNSNRVRIAIAEGELSGSREGEVCVFRGIPYAAPPVGPLRWQPPQPVICWQGVHDASSFGNASWQNTDYCQLAGGGDPGQLSEDCLYLNVWTPDSEAAPALPVIVWIHGGGFTIGSGGLAPYTGAPLAQRGVVMVTINYRLGHLGFFAHPALDAEYPDGNIVNNFALLDQIAALQWVQRNISAFGGNNNNITLVGESSGARSILALFCSPLTSGLFHKGIVQSAYALPDRTRRQALQTGCEVARYFGLENASASQLRELPAHSFWPLDVSLANGPVAIAGDAVLPESVLSCFAAGRQHRLPIIVGSNSDEGSILTFFGIDPAKTISKMRQRKSPIFYLLKWIYDIHDDALLGRSLARDIAFTLLTWLIVKAQHNVGMPSWRYWFDYVSENERDIYPPGTKHGNEIAYVLNTLNNDKEMLTIVSERPFTAADHAFAWRVSEYWLNFARDITIFSHTIQGELPWPAWHPGQDITLSLGQRGQGNILLKRNFMKIRMKLFQLLMKMLVRLN